ncbi:MAG: RNA polymerase sigma factor [Oscillospiraceae bacterium]|nr:RNA polymerase sigma factor [Oscillospiraceae bacterium]
MADIISLKNDIEAVYDMHADMLYRLALSYLQNNEDAQDAVQDVFIKYATASDIYRDEEHKKAWLIRVTVNRCNDMLRRRKLRTHIPLEEAYDVAAKHEESDSDIMKCLEKIPLKNRAAVILHYLEGYSVEETAAVLKISVSAVKMRLKRGREALQELIREVE